MSSLFITSQYALKSQFLCILFISILAMYFVKDWIMIITEHTILEETTKADFALFIITSVFMICSLIVDIYFIIGYFISI